MPENSNKIEKKTEKLPEKPAEKSPAALREEAVLKFWQENEIFEKSLLKQSPKGNFVFYDGPPYATGLPHVGHILPSTMKDIIPRYKTMQGYNVSRRWGWDCHGLPIENLIEKELGLKDKKAIEEYGIDKFNKAARDSVLRYASQWKGLISRAGRWVDMDNDYRTMDPSYTESVWWSFKALNEKGLVYEAFRVMPFCPRCQTPLSNFEVNLGYKDITDLSAYVKFELEDSESNTSGNAKGKTFFLAWTTTPWTLPGNTALAVNPELEYVHVKIPSKNSGTVAENSSAANTASSDLSGQTFILARDRVSHVLEKIKLTVSDVEISAPHAGKTFVGMSYKPVFDFYTKQGTLAKAEEPKRDNMYKVYAGEFVTAVDGTGIVHIAPAFGDDDYKLSLEKNIPMIQHVAQNGDIKENNGVLSGMKAKPKDTAENKDEHQKTDVEVIKLLAHQGSLFAKEKIIHSYPHCWRCDTPLLNYATSSWFIRVTEMREKLVAENKGINWVPKEVGEGRFGDWLENARDWNVSRTRYWGAPLPVWRGEKTGKLEFVGGISELKEHIPGNRNKLFLMRHGECESNVLNVMNSNPADLNKYALTEKGRSEVEESAKKLKQKEAETGKKVTKIYASDFRRTRETAEHMADALGLSHKDIEYDARIREIFTGDFDGKNWPERAAFLHTLHDKIFKKSPNGESVADVKKRTGEFLYEMDAKHSGENILVVTHGLPLRIMLDTIAGKTARDLLRSGWRDVSDPTASVHEQEFKPLPHNEDFELDIHRPYIDNVTWKSAEGDVMRRVPDVFDVWYDSGSMPFAQAHYPFENKEAFEQKIEEKNRSNAAGDASHNSALFPADFISEGLDQTRGWFYSLIVLGMGLFNKSPYKNVAVTGLILAEDGRKMSKSLRNYPDLQITLDKYGVDSLRYMLAASPAGHAEEVAFSEKSLDEVNKKIFNRFENVYSFYALYKSDATHEAAQHDAQHAAQHTQVGSGDEFQFVPQSKNVLDLWILSRLSELKASIEKGLDSYQIDKAARPIADFVDDLSTWYLRRSRDRFKGDDIADKANALEVTCFVLLTFSKIIAPFVPFMAEHMYLKMKESSKGEALFSAESVHLCEWPTLPSVDQKLIETMASARKLVETGLALRAKAGIKVRQPLASFTYDQNALSMCDELSATIADELNVKKLIKGSEISLDTDISKELKEEGAVREVIRAIQEMRKKAGLAPGDTIKLHINAEDSIKNIVHAYEKELKKSVLASEIIFTQTPSGDISSKEGMVMEPIDTEYGVLHAAVSR